MAQELTNEVYSFWFGKGDPHAEDYQHNNKLWWNGGVAVDKEITAKFGKYVEELITTNEGSLERELEQSPRGLLTLIIMLDQFTRSIYRGKPQMFSGDEKALKCAKKLVDSGQYKQLSVPERMFITTPYQHAENVAEVERSLKLTEELFEDSKGAHKSETKGAVKSARQHVEIIRNFGRYPHRNQVIGRQATKAEEEFLADAAKSDTLGFMKSVNSPNKTV